MKHTFKIYILFISFLFCTTTSFSQEWYDLITEEPVNVEAVKQSAEKYFDEIGRGKHTGYKLYQRWLENALHHLDKNGVPFTDKHISKELKKFNASANNDKQKRATGDAANDWVPMGPFYSQDNSHSKRLGRVQSMAIEPVDQQLLFAGSESGGVFRTRDAGTSWTPLCDQLDNMFVYAVGLDPHNSNHVLFLNSNSELMESLDQGDTWKQIANFDRFINHNQAIKFHPTLKDIFFVSTRNGLMKTTNGGSSFTKVIEERVEDIFFKPGDPTTMYSAGDDFWKSTDTGESWSKITNGINVSDGMKLTVTPADPNCVYVFQEDGGSSGRIYKSTNSGASFKIVTESDVIRSGRYLGSQSWRCMTIMCSTTDVDELHMGGLQNFRSDDGGATLYQHPNSDNSSSPAHFHADVLAMENVNGTLYVASDGGFFRSTDGGETYLCLSGDGSLENGLMPTQIFRIGGTSPYPGTGIGLDPDMVISGCMDNGTQITQNINFDWEQFTGSDGMECFIDYENPNNIYSSSLGGYLYKSTDGGETSQGLSTPESGGVLVPFEIDPITHTTIYVAYSEVYRSKNGGANWEAITSGESEGGRIYELAIAPSDNNYIYFCHGERLWASTNAQSTSATWREYTGFKNTINYITIDPIDPSRAVVVTTASEVYETKNAGVTWVDISGNLPNISGLSAVIDNTPEHTIYVGMERGIYYKNDNMTDWEVFGNGLPLCEVRELEIHYESSKLRAGTWGRGLWEIPIFGTSASIRPKLVAETNQQCLGDAIQLSVNENPAWETPISYQWLRNDVEILGATTTNYTALEEGSYSVKVTANKVSETSTGTYLTFSERLTAPSVTDTKICNPDNVTLTATGSEDGVLRWYEDEEGTNELAEGNTFSVDVTETSTYYVKEAASVVVSTIGLEDKIDNDGRYHAGGPYLIIDVARAFVLKSVKVYAEEAGERTIELRDAFDKLLLSKTVYVEAGESRVTLDLEIPAGYNLRIGIKDDGSKLHRSKGSIDYPLVLEDIVTIRGSSLTGYYYFFYDWEVQTSSEAVCPSASSEVTVTVDNCVGLSTYENENLTLFPNPTSGLIHLKLPENFELKTIEVTDIQGNSLLTHDKYVEQIDLQDFKSGAYLVKVTGDQGIKVFKIEVQ